MPHELEGTTPSDIEVAEVQAIATVERVEFVIGTWSRFYSIFAESPRSNIYHRGHRHIADLGSWHPRSTAS
jgi:hypothetical protein